MDRVKIAKELVKLAKELVSSTPNYNIQHNIGKSKYVVNYHDGKKTHRDGSPFFDIAIFANKVELEAFIHDLKRKGYVEKNS